MAGSLQSRIKDQEEQSTFSGNLLAYKISTLMLDKDKHVERLFQNERNMEEMKK